MIFIWGALFLAAMAYVACVAKEDIILPAFVFLLISACVVSCCGGVA